MSHQSNKLKLKRREEWKRGKGHRRGILSKPNTSANSILFKPVVDPTIGNGTRLVWSDTQNRMVLRDA